ncbi:Rpn family recombination-promoting nuclease/putative transposase [Caldanaerobacter subterraneus]|nr:Rpn family recombination-promoting nuclease/putative transposase [Caldanaerobacter subterraneus]
MGNKYDTTLKNMFSDLADDILSYFLEIQHVKMEELSIEFPRVETRESDMVFKCTTSGGNVIAVHIEFQSDNDNKMLYRMLRYATEIMEKYNLMPYQVVIYIGKSSLNMVNKIDFDFGKENFLSYGYKIIDVGEIKFSEIIQTNYYELFALLPLMDKKKRQEEKEQYLKKCVEAIKNIPLDMERKREIAARARILAELVYKKDAVDRMFAEVMKMLRLEDSETYRKLIKEGERNKSIEIAKKLLKEGMDIDKIAQITELPKEEIKKLLN